MYTVTLFITRDDATTYAYRNMVRATNDDTAFASAARHFDYAVTQGTTDAGRIASHRMFKHTTHTETH